MKKALIGIVTTVVGGVIGAVGYSMFIGKSIKEKDKKIDKFKNNYNLLNQWLMNKNEGKNVQQFFEENGYNSIAIYGMGELGNRLYEELKGSSIEVKYAIDKNSDSTYSELNVVGLEDEFEPVDAIIVTAFFAFDEIREDLEQKTDSPIVSMEDVIFSI